MKTKTFLLSVLAAGALIFIPSSAIAQTRPNQIVWNSPDTRVNPLFESYGNNVPFDDLDGYARSRYGATADAYLETNHAYGWKIKYRSSTGWRVVGIDMRDAAKYHGLKKYGMRLKNWGCYFRDWTGLSWRGAYIVRN